MQRILLIDDDEFIRKPLRQMLERQGHQVTEARDGKEGCRLMQHVAVDLVITDLLMPEQDGLETIMRLRFQRPDLRVIAMSGVGRFEGNFLNVAHRLGAATVLKKPFEERELIEAIGGGR